MLGLDVLGNPVKVVRGVVEGTFDLFYEPIKVSKNKLCPKMVLGSAGQVDR